MNKKLLKLVLAAGLAMLVMLAAGCGGGGGAQRITGLTADGVVKTFFDEAKAGHLNDAALYVSASSTNDPRVVMKYLAGQTVNDLKNANLLSLTKAAEQGNFAVVVATLQTQANSLNIVVKPVGLEKVGGEWYIVDFDKAFQDAKYQALAQLLSKV